MAKLPVIPSGSGQDNLFVLSPCPAGISFTRDRSVGDAPENSHGTVLKRKRRCRPPCFCQVYSGSGPVSPLHAPVRECVYRFNRFSNQEKGIASMSSLLFRFLPLHVCWLASFGIILAYRSSLTTTAFIVFLLLFVTGAYGTLALLRKLSAGLLWLFHVAVFICWGCDAFFVMAAGRNTAVLILGGLPFALLLAPVLVLSLAFMMEQGAIRIRTILAAICFHTSCLPVLILATLLIVS